MKNYIKKLLLLSLALVIYTPFTFNMEAPKPAPAPGDKRTADEAFENKEVQEDDASQDFEKFLLTETQLFGDEEIVPYDINQLDDLEMLQSPPANTLPESLDFIPEEIQAGDINQELPQETNDKEEVGPSLAVSKKTYSSRLYICKHCPFTKNNRGLMITHLQKDHKFSKPWRDHYYNNETRDKVACDFPKCTVMVKADGLPLHYNRVHGPGAQLVECIVCGAEVKRYLLYAHKKLHTS